MVYIHSSLPRFHEALTQYMRLTAEFGTTPLADIRLKNPMQGELPFDLDG